LFILAPTHHHRPDPLTLQVKEVHVAAKNNNNKNNNSETFSFRQLMGPFGPCFLNLTLTLNQ
jgi:hypothetical protein